MIVSLSASHGDHPKCIALLRTCDVIYTTQWARLEEFKLAFPDAHVLLVPDARNDLLEFLRARHKGDTVYDFSTLFSIRLRATEQRIVQELGVPVASQVVMSNLGSPVIKCEDKRPINTDINVDYSGESEFQARYETNT